jgi:hypothetical protein
MSEKHPQECFNCIGQTHLEAYYSSTHVVPSVIVQRAVLANQNSTDQCYGFREIIV